MQQFKKIYIATQLGIATITATERAVKCPHHLGLDAVLHSVHQIPAKHLMHLMFQGDLLQFLAGLGSC